MIDTGPSPARDPAGSPALRRDPAFRAIWAGQTASFFGDQVTGLALPWLILLQTRSPLDAGLVAAVRYVPPLGLALVAGVVADRADRRALLIASDAGRALALGVVALLGALGRVPALWLLAGVVFVLGTGQLLFQVAYRAWLPDVTGDARLSRAASALEASDAASVLLGYPLAGALIAAVGPALALGADALSYVVSALTLGGVRARRTLTPGPSPVRGGGERAERTEQAMGPRALAVEAVAGVRYLLAQPAQRLLKGAGAALYLDAGAIEVLLATLTQLHLHLPAWKAGLVFGAMGAGGLIGSALGPRVYARGWRRGLAATLAVAALGALGLAWAGVLAPAAGFLVAALASLVLDGSIALGFILSGTAGTLLTPRALRGRVNAAGTIYSSALRGLAAIGGGALASAGDPLPAFLVLAACCAGAALVAARARPTAEVDLLT